MYPGLESDGVLRKEIRVQISQEQDTGEEEHARRPYRRRAAEPWQEQFPRDGLYLEKEERAEEDGERENEIRSRASAMHCAKSYHAKNKPREGGLFPGCLSCLSSLPPCFGSALWIVSEVTGIILFPLAATAFRGDLASFLFGQTRKTAAAPFTAISHVISHMSYAS